jgi:hypothetical protein
MIGFPLVNLVDSDIREILNIRDILRDPLHIFGVDSM